VTAAVKIAHELGIPKLTVEAVCRGARMSKGTFYGLFGSSDAFVGYCFETTFERTTGTFLEAIERDEPCWRQKFDRAVAALFATVSAEPLPAELCLVHCFQAPEQSLEHSFEKLVCLLKTSLEEGRRESRLLAPRDWPEPPPGAEEYLARALASFISQRLRTGNAGCLPAYRADMLTLVLTIFFGPRVAKAHSAGDRTDAGGALPYPAPAPGVVGGTGEVAAGDQAPCAR
jgi:AcrR family transcriptional regulator